MAQEYKLIQLKPGDFQDNHGNTWCDAAFEGVSEPVKWVVKDPRAYTEGESYYGEIKDMTSKAGKAYLRFYRQLKPEDEQQVFSAHPHPSPRRDYVDHHEAIKAQWAIGQAVQLSIANGKLDLEAVEADAKQFYTMVDRIAGSAETPSVVSPAATSGYDKFKASKPTAKSEKDEDAEIRSLLESNMNEALDPAEIPF